MCSSSAIALLLHHQASRHSHSLAKAKAVSVSSGHRIAESTGTAASASSSQQSAEAEISAGTMQSTAGFSVGLGRLSGASRDGPRHWPQKKRLCAARSAWAQPCAPAGARQQPHRPPSPARPAPRPDHTPQTWRRCSALQRHSHFVCMGQSGKMPGNNTDCFAPGTYVIVRSLAGKHVLPQQFKKREASSHASGSSGTHLGALLAVDGQPVGHQPVQVELLGWLLLAALPEGSRHRYSSGVDRRGT